jgi:hypothetical protein
VVSLNEVPRSASFLDVSLLDRWHFISTVAKGLLRALLGEMRLSMWFALASLLITFHPALSQTPDPSLRAAEIQKERLNKSTGLVPDEPDRIEKRFIQAMNEIRRYSKIGPVRIQTGGLAAGAGFAVNPSVTWKNRTDDLRLGFSAAGSTRGFYTLRAGALFPGFINRQLQLHVETAHSDAPKLEYYGPGPDSEKGGRSTYRREDTTLEAGLAWIPHHRRVMTGVTAGPLFINVGPGKDSRFASAETLYAPAQAPGIDVQTNFFRTSGYIDFDFRDFPRDPHRGTRAAAVYQRYTDFKRHLYSFDRISAVAEQYFSFLNKKRVVGLRSAIDLSYHGDDQEVPFYLQPTLGGPYDLTGFRRYRFTDNNRLFFGAEYRWEVSAAFEMALFADAGKVFHEIQDIRLTGLERSAGFGFRFKARDSVAFRIDTGFSREGFQTWVLFSAGF